MRARGDTHRSAITLIEVLLVVMILATIAIQAAPKYADSMAAQSLQAASHRLKEDLASVRLLARQTSEPQQLIFDVAQSRYFVPGSLLPNRNGDIYQIRLEDAPYNTSIVTAEFANQSESVAFSKFGIPNDVGTVTLRAGNFQRTLRILETGAIDMNAIVRVP